MIDNKDLSCIECTNNNTHKNINEEFLNVKKLISKNSEQNYITNQIINVEIIINVNIHRNPKKRYTWSVSSCKTTSSNNPNSKLTILSPIPIFKNKTTNMLKNF